MNRAEAIMNAWKKIQEYVKKEYDGVFEKGIRIRWKHEVYGWTEFGVTSTGDAYICHGSHGCGDRMTDWFYHPDTRKPTFERTRMTHTEKVVNDWEIIKQELYKMALKERLLYNFQV